MNITVYLASRIGNHPAFSEAAETLGTWIGKNGHTLVYGGSKIGLMGILGRAALAAGAPVIGVEPQMFVDEHVELENLTELIVTPDIALRRKVMFDRGDIFVALPGGVGTLEEISEIICSIHLHALNAHCIFLNLNGYYDGMKCFFDRMKAEGFYQDREDFPIRFANDTEELLHMLEAAAH